MWGGILPHNEHYLESHAHLLEMIQRMSYGTLRVEGVHTGVRMHSRAHATVMFQGSSSTAPRLT